MWPTVSAARHLPVRPFPVAAGRPEQLSTYSSGQLPGHVEDGLTSATRLDDVPADAVCSRRLPTPGRLCLRPAASMAW